MASGGGSIRARTGAAAFVVLLSVTPAAAQTVNEYRLPGTVTTQPSGSAPGPVDSDVPVVRAPAPQPGAQPAQTQSDAAPAARPSARPAPELPRREARRSEPTAQAQPQVQPTSATAQPEAEAEASTAPANPPPALPTGVPASAPVLVPTSDGTDSPVSPLWPWGALLVALLAGGAGGWFLHRRKTRPLAITFEPPLVAPREPEAPHPPAATPAESGTAPVAATPRPEPAAKPAAETAAVPAQGLTIALEARRMSASLMATTLSYTLRLTNNGEAPLSALAIEGDMISAHASLPPEQQIASDSHRLELRHAAVELAPGQSAEFTGDFRLPLSAVTPIRSGEAAYFVPLARFRVEAGVPGGGSQVLVQTFVVGEMPNNPGAGLRPFRLDLGPRVYSRIGQRAVA